MGGKAEQKKKNEMNKQTKKQKKKEKKKKKRTFFRSVASHANDTQGRRIKPRYLLTVNSLGALIIYIRVYIKIDWWQPTIQLVDIYDISDRSRSEDKKEKKKRVDKWEWNEDTFSELLPFDQFDRLNLISSAHHSRSRRQGIEVIHFCSHLSRFA